jgi:hypothetical protein
MNSSRASARGHADGSSSAGRSGSRPGKARHSSITLVRAMSAFMGGTCPAAVVSRNWRAKAMKRSYRERRPSRSQARSGMSHSAGTDVARKAVAVAMSRSFR